MRLGFPAGSTTVRDQWYDRNPVLKQYGAAQHVWAATAYATLQFSYTVPAGKKAKIDGMSASITWTSATVPNAGQVWQFETLGGSGLMYLDLGPTNPDRQATLSMSPQTILTAGQGVRVLETNNNTTAGATGTMSASILLTEFDA